MTNTTHDPIAANRSEHKARTLYSLEGAAKLQRADCHAGREYLPMDIFVNPEAMKQHFQRPSSGACGTGMRAAAA